MKRRLALSATLAITGFAVADWPGFRGDGSSSAPEATPPTTWSVEEGTNVAWTADLPGRGVAGPIVVGGRVVVTASDGPLQERLHVLAFDEATGKRLWARQVWATGRSNCHETSAIAAPTPASDGERVFAFYSSSDLVAYDLDGNLQWMRGLTLTHPGVGNDIGMSSSPVVAGDAVVVQSECQGESFAAAVDRRTGATLWDLDRPKLPNWASPLAWRTAEGRDAVWLQDGSGATLHDALTGEELARIKNDTAGIPSPAPAADGTLVLAAGGITLYRAPFEKPLLSAGNLQPGSPSPAVAGDKVLVVNRGGVLTCGDLDTGDVVWRKRLGGQFWATPVIAGGNAYCVNAEGEATVVAMESGEVVSKADFAEGVLGSPAVANNAVYFRSNGHLWKIAATGQASAPSDAARR
jgi:outer membrane protein assembly factor BamB